MTMVNAVIQDGAAYLYSDTALIDSETGVVLGFDSKVRVGAHFPWAVGVTYNGHPKATEALGSLQGRTVKRLLAQVPAALLAYRKLSIRYGCAKPSIRLVIAAWDEALRTPRIFAAGDGLEEFAPSPWCPPGITEMGFFFGADLDGSELWSGKTPNDPASFDLVRDGVAAFEARRRKAFEPIGGSIGAGNYVGGEIHLTEITRHGVNWASIHKWPDEAGEPIQPVPASA